MKLLILCNRRKYMENGKFRHWGKGYRGSWHEEFFREEIARLTDSFSYGWGYDEDKDWTWEGNLPLPEIIEKYYKPDVILTNDLINYPNFNDVKNILKVHRSGDYHKNFNEEGSDQHYRQSVYDISFGYSTSIKNHLKENNVGKYQYVMPFGANTNMYKKDKNAIKDIDVSAFYGANESIYPLRKKIVWMIQDMDVVFWSKRIFFDNAIDIIHRSKICIDCNFRFKFVNPRITETLSCGSFLLTDWCDDLDKLGYIDGHHLVSFDSLDDLKDKILYYLENEDEREEIALNGMDFVRENYNDTVLAKKFIDIIRKHI